LAEIVMSSLRVGLKEVVFTSLSSGNKNPGVLQVGFGMRDNASGLVLKDTFCACTAGLT